MAYVKTTWATGDVITAAKLNNMESGIEAHDPLIVSVENTEAGSVMSETWQAICDALTAGKRVITLQTAENYANEGMIIYASYNDRLNTYSVVCLEYAGGELAASEYKATSADGYPTLTE